MQPTIQSLTFRVGDATTNDYDRFAELVNRENVGQNVTADTLRSWDANKIADDIFARYAACLNERIIGYGVILNEAIAQKPSFYLWLTIDAEYQKQGYGQQFYNFLAQQALEHGATEFTSECLADAVGSFAFAQKQGFTVRRHAFASKLDLTTFDVEAWLPVVDKVKAQGIRFTSLAAEGNTEAAQRKLFELNTVTANDNPSSEGQHRNTFENFQSKILGAAWFRADGQLLAVDGERYVGLGAVGFEADEVTAFNAFTGIDKEYRGRGIAQALKVLAAQYAQSKGATAIVTGNDSENAPMLGINDKLGYVRQAGVYLLVKRDL